MLNKTWRKDKFANNMTKRTSEADENFLKIKRYYIASTFNSLDEMDNFLGKYKVILFD